MTKMARGLMNHLTDWKKISLNARRGDVIRGRSMKERRIGGIGGIMKSTKKAASTMMATRKVGNTMGLPINLKSMSVGEGGRITTVLPHLHHIICCRLQATGSLHRRQNIIDDLQHNRH